MFRGTPSFQNQLNCTPHCLPPPVSGVLSGSTPWLSGKRLSLKALPVEFCIRPGPVGIVTLKDRTVSPVAQLFIDHAREIAKPLAS